jgi:hypothetical protein
MNLTIQIPDDLARDLAAAGGDLSRRALEAFALEEFKTGRLTKPALRQLLGYATRDQLDEFLEAHAVVEDSTPASIAHLQKADPKEWARHFDAWLNSHDPNTPVLSDDAMSRESIYPDRI